MVWLDNSQAIVRQRSDNGFTREWQDNEQQYLDSGWFRKSSETV